MPELGGVQAVDGPGLAVIDAGLGRQVDAEPAVPLVDLVVHLVEEVDTGPESSAERAGEVEDAAMVVEPDSEEQGTLPGQPLSAVEQILAKRGQVPRGAHGVVEADDEGGDVGPVVQCGFKLVAAYVAGGRA